MAIFQQKTDVEGYTPSPAFPSGSSGARAETVVGASVSLEGDFSSKEDIVIHGSVRGTVTTESDLTIGESAQVRANISAETITVSGLVEGTVKATGRLRITATGRVKGDLSARTLAVEEGAEITGQCSMGKALENQERVSSYVKEDQTAAQKSQETNEAEARSADAERDVEELLPEIA